MPHLLITGFPGFLGSALLPRLLDRRPGTEALCLVQSQHLETAGQRLSEMVHEHPHLDGRIALVEGDITVPGLGLGIGIGDTERAALEAVDEVWHLAAVYDLSVDKEIAHRVNVDGTAHVLEFCRTRATFKRLQYVSTCYVSGAYDGEFGEDMLDEGQPFRNHYESTKFEAEQLVREAIAGGLPATIYRPGIVVGDSSTGETQKYDGPYYLATFLRRQLGIAVVPALGDLDDVKVCVVPRDFVVDAMDQLSVLDVSVGKTYALADEQPPSARELIDTFADRMGKRVVWVPLPLSATRAAVGAIPGMERLLGLPAESLDYFASPTRYSTTNTTTDLAGTGLVCPPFASYAGHLIDYMEAHPEVDAKAMV